MGVEYFDDRNGSMSHHVHRLVGFESVSITGFVTFIKRPNPRIGNKQCERRRPRGDDVRWKPTKGTSTTTSSIPDLHPESSSSDTASPEQLVEDYVAIPHHRPHELLPPPLGAAPPQHPDLRGRRPSPSSASTIPSETAPPSSPFSSPAPAAPADPTSLPTLPESRPPPPPPPTSASPPRPDPLNLDRSRRFMEHAGRLRRPRRHFLMVEGHPDGVEGRRGRGVPLQARGAPHRESRRRQGHQELHALCKLTFSISGSLRQLLPI
ncbi:hypothetical protein C4D60_Mb00t19190 [Musa balbisiana]|uniref:Uncharacterized protein n=1 Tax=Musa balbisiana TaxID=52838 RepID=A0A4S8I538_MUSBA|nr:hypothetical protein C4D60_Mb00t19190 [Musa balbisiana]